MKSLLALLLLVVSLLFFGNKTVDLNIYEQWKADFGFKFQDHEDAYRKIVFFKNLISIEEHNSKGDSTYEKGVNQFTHLSSHEFSNLFLGKYFSEKKSNINQNEPVKIVKEVDWEALGKVSAVKNQGNCDAGYAFCTVSLLQSYYLLKNVNVTLSEQQVIDCSQNYTTFGCQGGSRIGTIQYIDEHGLVLQASYPYQAKKGSCVKDSGQYKPEGTLTESNGCDGLANGLTVSPMTIAVNAKDFQTYKSGIFDGCTSTEVNHDIYLIGVTNTYWRLKNSWGSAWGESGYIRLKMGNTCGICEKTGFGFK